MTRARFLDLAGRYHQAYARKGELVTQVSHVSQVSHVFDVKEKWHKCLKFLSCVISRSVWVMGCREVRSQMF